MPVTITRRFEFDAGHRLQKHESKCRNVHGHRYVFDLTVRAPELDSVGRVMDFGVVKALVGTWLDEVFDHGFIAEDGDPIIDWMLENGQKLVVLDGPPTIEHLVEAIFVGAQKILAPHGVTVVHLRGYETPNCWADYHERSEPQVAGDRDSGCEAVPAVQRAAPAEDGYVEGVPGGRDVAEDGASVRPPAKE